MPFRVAIDIRRIGDFGIGTYIRNLLRGLGNLDSETTYLLVASRDVTADLPDLGPNFEIVRFHPPRHAWASQFAFSMFLRSLRADLYHIPLNAVPLGMPRPYVVTVHDMSTLIFDPSSVRSRRLRVWRFRRGLRRATRVIAVSTATRRDIEELLSIAPSRVRVVYNAPDPAFHQPDSAAIACVAEDGGISYRPEIKRTLDRYQIDYPFLLYAGTIRPQKNIPRMVEAFSVVRAEMDSHPLYRGLRLIIIGDEISNYQPVRRAVIESRVEHAVRFLGFVPIGTLRVFYQAASLFLFPSLYEGFGLPPLEAMACGTPVVCSRASSLAEVVGDAAVIVNPENVFDIARGIREVLLEPGLRGMMAERGIARAASFDWRRTAAAVLEIYRESAGQV